MAIQVRLQVSDQSSPEKTAEARVFVEIERDLKSPKFDNTQYKAEIDENIEADAVVPLKPSAVKARDEDKKVLVHPILCQIHCVWSCYPSLCLLWISNSCCYEIYCSWLQESKLIVSLLTLSGFVETSATFRSASTDLDLVTVVV